MGPWIIFNFYFLQTGSTVPQLPWNPSKPADHGAFHVCRAASEDSRRPVPVSERDGGGGGGWAQPVCSQTSAKLFIGRTRTQEALSAAILSAPGEGRARSQVNLATCEHKYLRSAPQSGCHWQDITRSVRQNKTARVETALDVGNVCVYTHVSDSKWSGRREHLMKSLERLWILTFPSWRWWFLKESLTGNNSFLCCYWNKFIAAFWHQNLTFSSCLLWNNVGMLE